jgi:uncharacterized protein with HEPN domain
MQSDLVPLYDILKEIEFLHTVRSRTTLESFRQSPTDIRAASFSILVISEAVRRIPDDWLAAYPDMPWHAIRTIGNKLRHEYQRISETIVWGVIATHCDALEATIADMLARHGA